MTVSAWSQWDTWSEIEAQPSIWQAWGPDIGGRTDELRRWIRGLDIDEIWLSGAGTSAYIGDIVADGLPRALGLPVRPVASTDIVSAPHRYFGGTARPLVINFGRSGNSAESLGVLAARDALAPGAPTLNITCNPQSALARSGTSATSRVILLPENTHDSGFAMTASFSTMLLSVLALLDETVDPAASCQALARCLAREMPRICDWVAECSPASRVVFVGAGPLRFAAREAALKVLELTAGRSVALWDSSLGFRHGPKSFMNEDTLAVMFRSSDPHAARYDQDLVDELRAQFPEARVEVLGGTTDPVRVDDTLPDVWRSAVFVAAAQVMAVAWSDAMGLSVDNPFDGKGTLTRVVDGVRLYPAGGDNR